MMRSPKALAIAVRKASGEIVMKERPWKSVGDSLPFLKWPFFRGPVALLEAMVNGIDALTFSANETLEDEGEEEMGFMAMVLTIAAAFGLGILLFVVAPHYLSLLLGRLGPLEFGVSSLTFHLLDGIIKMSFFLAYIWGISRIKEIGRMFEYHGAEHKSIYAYEAGEELTIENAREHTTLHPRCGTAFILVVLMISILLFSVVFPLIIPQGQEKGFLINLLFVLVKIILMLPIAGISYELNRYASKHMDNFWFKAAIFPGMMLQKLTTREPSDDQIEVALEALKMALAIEAKQNNV